MGHLTGRRRERAEVTTPSEWLTAGAQIADFCNSRARRFDIVVRMAEETVAKAPACFIPKTAELEVSFKECFDPGLDPSMLGPMTDPKVRLEHPVASGVILHEASHARWTTWSLENAAELGKSDEKYGKLLTEAMHWLEESRIESLATDTWPRDRELLRSSALRLALADSLDTELPLTSTVALLQIACLSEARVVGGVLDAIDIENVTTQLVEGLGIERLEEARKIFARVHDFSPKLRTEKLFENMATAARDLLDLMTDEEREEQQQQMANAAENGDEGEPGEGGGMGEMLGAIMDAMSEAADATEVDARGEAAQQVREIREEEQARERANEARERESEKATAAEVFGVGSSRGSDRTSSRIVETRLPSGAERAMAVRLGRDLERINYTERRIAHVNSMLPPGRLRGRAAVLGAAQRAQGIAVDAAPWHAKHRHHVDSAPLTAGVMVDISGSMHAAMEPMATTAWVLSEAVRRVQGTAAMVYYGNSVFPTLKPNQHLEKVTVWTAPDGTEEFGTAARALNGALNLTGGDGARVLFVVSDGYYRHDQRDEAAAWIKKFHAAGVAVVWITVEQPSWSSVTQDAEVAQRIKLVVNKDVTQLMSSVGAAVVDTFKRAQARR